MMLWLKTIGRDHWQRPKGFDGDFYCSFIDPVRSYYIRSNCKNINIV